MFVYLLAFLATFLKSSGQILIEFSGNVTNENGPRTKGPIDHILDVIQTIVWFNEMVLKERHIIARTHHI